MDKGDRIFTMVYVIVTLVVLWILYRFYWNVEEKTVKTMDGIFEIPDYKIDTPLRIKQDGYFLSVPSPKNQIVLQERSDDGSVWVIEQDGTTQYFYVKTLSNRYNHTCYLGCPNRDGSVYLYTSKNKFTRWKIEPTDDPHRYRIQYAGEKFDPSAVALVVARYAENIEWVRAYNDIAIVYNKGRNDLEGIRNVQRVINIGREGHTYLYHIIQNYDQLTDRVIFSQGDPFLHNETILFGVDNYGELAPIQPMGLRYLTANNMPPERVIKNHRKKTPYGLDYLVIKANGNLVTDDFVDNGMNQLPARYMREGNPYNKVYNLMTNFLYNAKWSWKPPSIHFVYFTFCGLFSVHQSVIRKHEVTVYQNLLNHLVSIDKQGGASGYILEKAWLYIFGYAP